MHQHLWTCVSMKNVQTFNGDNNQTFKSTSQYKTKTHATKFEPLFFFKNSLFYNLVFNLCCTVQRLLSLNYILELHFYCFVQKRSHWRKIRFAGSYFVKSWNNFVLTGNFGMEKETWLSGSSSIWVLLLVKKYLSRGNQTLFAISPLTTTSTL